MSIKLQKISELQPSLPFTEFDIQQKYLESFKQSELGRIHAQLPLKELAEKLADVFPKKHPQGNKHLFSPEGVNMPYVKNSWPSGLPRMQNSDSMPIFDAFIAISHQMAF